MASAFLAPQVQGSRQRRFQRLLSALPAIHRQIQADASWPTPACRAAFVNDKITPAGDVTALAGSPMRLAH